ncbi:hypothetical protein ABBQ32_011672 [Trebouxia sp. C0010 RCD-2024]
MTCSHTQALLHQQPGTVLRTTPLHFSKPCQRPWVPGSKWRCSTKTRAHSHNSNGGSSSESTSSQEQQPSIQHQASLQEVAEQCFQDSPDTKARLRRVGSAAAQVAALQAAQADLAKQMREAAQSSPQDNRRLERQQAQAASERGSQADVVQAAEDLQAAANELVAAEAERSKWQSSIDEAAEKTESAKAAAIAGFAGGLASLPYIVAAGHPPLSCALSAAVCLVSCILFGVTFRYAVRQDLQNLQLKGGVVAAFGLVRGSAQADMLQLSAGSPFGRDTLAQAAVVAGESMLTFGFAAVALELAFRNGKLKPFGFEKPML